MGPKLGISAGACTSSYQELTSYDVPDLSIQQGFPGTLWVDGGSSFLVATHPKCSFHAFLIRIKRFTHNCMLAGATFPMPHTSRSVLFFCLLAGTLSASAQQPEPLRAPATPLVAHNPFFSVWSMSDRLTDKDTRHWTGKPQPLTGLIRIDAKTFRWLGAGDEDDGVPALKETSRTLTPTRTITVQQGSGIELTITFMDAALPQDLSLMSRPVTYLTWSARSTDQRQHQVSLYLDAAGTLATNDRTQSVIASRATIQGLDLLRIGAQEQPILKRFGDDVRIDWGYFYLAVPQQSGSDARLAAGTGRYRDTFVDTGTIPNLDDLGEARSPQNQYPPAPMLNVVLPLGSVGPSPVSRHILVAYDDFYSVEFMQQKLLPFWRTQSPTFAAMLTTAEEQYVSIQDQTRKLDEQLTADLTRIGGPEYAVIATLAYRQAIAAHALVEGTGAKPFFMPKENFSNGSISTVDVIYPSAPIFLLLNPKLVEAQLLPVLLYAEMPRWRFPFAPHDLGVYPLANGQQYGGGEESEADQMPVEESGDILLLVAAIAHAEGNTDFARQFWPLLTKWADYLSSKGLDPENQLSTDDFAGHLAHNANLSIKAIEALGAYSQLAKQLGHADEARKYRAIAEEMAKRWGPMAIDGDHYKLAFDKPDTWSQKYNLVWDTILNLDLFPTSIRQQEVAYYKTKMNPYGLPLDNRATYTKLDWEIWAATMTSNRADFQTLIHPIWKFLNETPDRIPMSDWYDTITAKMIGFQARSVVGGVYIPMLSDKQTWAHWAHMPNQ